MSCQSLKATLQADLSYAQDTMSNYLRNLRSKLDQLNNLYTGKCNLDIYPPGRDEICGTTENFMSILQSDIDTYQGQYDTYFPIASNDISVIDCSDTDNWNDQVSVAARSLLNLQAAARDLVACYCLRSPQFVDILNDTRWNG
jgi:hypothetical protein